MAEWFKRGTVNTFYRGSNPLKTLNKKSKLMTIKKTTDKTQKTNFLFI